MLLDTFPAVILGVDKGVAPALLDAGALEGYAGVVG